MAPPSAARRSGICPVGIDSLQLQDHQVLPGGPYSSTLQVHDRIILEGGRGGAATISFINQTFSVVPEPTVALMALLGLPMLARRRAN